MRRLVSVASVAAGALLVVIPRWVFPACGHGDLPTRCAQTARAEMVLGVVLVAAGVLAWDARRPAAIAAHAVGSCVLLALAWIAPSFFGYCASPRMPCHYGMVPGVRFVAALAGAALVAAAASIASARRRGREAA